MITSIFENTRNPVIVYILHDETLTEDNKNKFMRTAQKYNQEINFIDLEKFEADIIKRIPETVIKRYTAGTLYRFFIPDLIQVEKIIYIDSDVVVNLDIKELWNIDIENYAMAATLHPKRKKTIYGKIFSYLRERIHKSDRNKYFNAGVLLMNLKLIRETCNLFEISAKWLERYADTAYCPDQDALNSLFRGKIKFIDLKFNNQNPENEAETKNSIIHTPGISDLKTWNMNGQPAQKIYWKMYARSAWGENKNIDEIINVLCEAAYKKPLPPKPLYKKILSPWKQIIYPNDLKLIFSMIFSEFKYSLTH